MTHLIDKDALIAEIERRIDKLHIYLDDERNQARSGELYLFEQYINTIEVTEVDLEKEISFQWSKFCLYDKDKDSFVKVAKYFFELGLKIQKEE